MIAFTALGLPAPQGSKRHVGNGVMVESSKKVAPWRDAVHSAALDAMASDPVNRFPLDGPLIARMVFTLPRPKSAPKALTLPMRTPDLSKLIRSTEDALTTSGLIADDARIVEYQRACKVWWGYDDEALPTPGAVIVLRYPGAVADWCMSGAALGAVHAVCERMNAASPSTRTGDTE